MKKIETIINIEEITAFFEEHCQEMGISSPELNLAQFVDFLEADFFDWLQENFNFFIQLKANDNHNPSEFS